MRGARINLIHLARLEENENFLNASLDIKEENELAKLRLAYIGLLKNGVLSIEKRNNRKRIMK